MVDRYFLARERMVREQLEARGIEDPLLLDIFRQVPRHLFVDAEQAERAYEPYPLSLMAGQTISQPYVVAYMTALLQLTKSDKVLEIGTGSGYQTVILSHLCSQVYSVERLNVLINRARKTFDRLGRFNIRSKLADGSQGWVENALYQAIIVTAGAPDVPAPLLDQLADGGRLIIPVGSREQQVLTLVERRGERFKRHELAPVRFVDLVGSYGWDK